MAAILYLGDRVRIRSWSPSFNGMRGVVVAAPEGRVGVRLEGDEGPTLFFPGEVVRDEGAE